MNQEKKMNKVYLPHFDNGMSYSDHSDITYGKVYTNIEDAINFILQGYEGDYGEMEPYIITKENHFDDKWHERYAFGENRLPYLFQPDVTKLPEYDFRTELSHDEIDEFAYIEILEVKQNTDFKIEYKYTEVFYGKYFSYDCSIITCFSHWNSYL